MLKNGVRRTESIRDVVINETEALKSALGLWAAQPERKVE